MGAGVILIALKAFALGASGSVSALAGLTESALALTGIVSILFASRWQPALSRMDEVTADAVARLIQSGMTMAAAIFVGLIALFGIFDPRPVAGGLWAVAAIMASLGVAAGLIWHGRRAARHPGQTRAPYIDLVPGLVVLIGVSAGTLLNAPGLDAVAALVVAVWLFWGAFAPIRSAASLLGQA